MSIHMSHLSRLFLFSWCATFPSLCTLAAPTPAFGMLPDGVDIYRLQPIESSDILHVLRHSNGEYLLFVERQGSPSVARRISPDGKTLGERDVDVDGDVKGLWLIDDHPTLVKTSFSETRGWQLVELKIAEDDPIERSVVYVFGAGVLPLDIWMQNNHYGIAFEHNTGPALMVLDRSEGLRWTALIEDAKGSITSCRLSEEGAAVIAINAAAHDKFGEGPQEFHAMAFDAEGDIVRTAVVQGRFGQLIAADKKGILLVYLNSQMPFPRSCRLWRIQSLRR